MKKQITDRVKSVEDAFKELGRKMEMPDMSMLPEPIANNATSTIKLLTVIEALNEGWFPSEDDGGYTPYWWIDWPNGSSAAFGYSHTHLAPSFTNSYFGVGFRLRLKTRALAKYVAEVEQFKKLYEAIIIK